MPNHVSHRVYFNMEACADLLMQMKLFPKEDKNMHIDFNLFAPEPQLEGEGWYGWRRSNWGTMCNAYDQNAYTEGSQWVLQFQTARSTPGPIWETIADKFPNAKIDVYYADEGTGNNLGYIHIADGVCDWSEFSNGTPEEKLEVLNQVHGPGLYGY